jgi:hypothetical protein
VSSTRAGRAGRRRVGRVEARARRAGWPAARHRGTSAREADWRSGGSRARTPTADMRQHYNSPARSREAPSSRARREGGTATLSREGGGQIAGGQGGLVAGSPTPWHGRWTGGVADTDSRQAGTGAGKALSRRARWSARELGGTEAAEQQSSAAQRSAWRWAVTARALGSCGWSGGLRKKQP